MKTARPAVIPLLAATAIVALLSAAGCGSGGGLRPELGKPVPMTHIVVGPLSDDRFDYVVHLSGDRRLADRAYRMERAMEALGQRCKPGRGDDLYAHNVGTWPDGSARLSYAIGITCIK